MSWKECNHGPVQECSSFAGSSTHDVEVRAGERCDMKNADEFVQRHRFIVDKHFLFICVDDDLERSFDSAGFCSSLDRRFFLTVANAFLWFCSTEAPTVAEEIDRLKQVCLPLSVEAAKQICGGKWTNLLRLDVAEIKNAEPE